MTTRVLDLRSASEFLSLSSRTLRKHLPSIPHFTSPVGGKFLFRTDELLAWLENYRVKPVDLGAAFAMAEQITSAGFRKKGKRSKKEDAT